MLTAEKLTGELAASCDKCGAIRVGELGSDRAAADRTLRLSGWTPMPRKNQGVEKWAWHCAACSPNGDALRGCSLTTAMMPNMKGDK